jgi:hypothetical protein
MTARIKRVERNHFDKAQRTLDRAEADLIEAESALLESGRSHGGSEADLDYLRKMFCRNSGRVLQ